MHHLVIHKPVALCYNFHIDACDHSLSLAGNDGMWSLLALVGRGVVTMGVAFCNREQWV